MRLASNSTVSDRLAPSKYAAMAVLIHFMVALLRCLFILSGPLSLHGEEAQYWTWSQHLDWSYFSKPPLIAFCNDATQWLFGHSEFSVRINAVLCGMLIGWVTYLFAFRLYQSGRKAFWASMLVLVMPFYFEVSLIYSTDSILLLCSLVAAYCFWQATETNRWRYWLMLGLVLGIGSLGKYAMFFFIPILFLYLALHDRAQLSNPRLYVAILLCLVIFSPVIVWNINHQFIGYKHIENLSGLSCAYHWRLLNLVNFTLGQILLMSPLFVVMYVQTYKAYRKQKVMSFFLIPMLSIWTVFFFISIIKSHEANINWTMFVYVGLPILLASYIVDYHKEKTAMVLSGLTLALLLSLTTVPLWTSEVSKKILPVRADPIRKIAVWRDVANKVNDVYRACDRRPAFIFTDDYMLTSELLFYLYPDAHIYFVNNGSRLCQFQLWKGVEQYNNSGCDALFVECSSVSRKTPQVSSVLSDNIVAAFARVERPIQKVCYYRGDPAYQVDIYPLKGFKSLKAVPFTHY